MTAKTLQTVSRAIAMLRALDGGNRSLTLTELSGVLSLDKANTSRLAKTLVVEGLLVRDPRSLSYSISVGCLALCRGIIGKNSLAEVARPHLEHARDITGETACLMIREAWDRVVVETVPSRQPVRYILDPGDRRSIFIGASGQCLIAGLTDPDWTDLLRHIADERAAGRHSISDDLLQDRMNRLHQNGWAVGRGEWAADAAGAAAPVVNAKDETIAAVTLAIPLTRATDTHLEMCGRMVLATAQAINGDLQKYGI
ncbi:MAG: IclR family transcriptional regulator [Rhodobacteraceae bacterium]|nr:IclR family transcriptional regulator [Paracoccaceae bacterium]